MPLECQFKQEMLDKLIAAFNTKLNSCIPRLNITGQSKMTESIFTKGWKWSLNDLK